MDADVAVVGGGMAGISIACELASTHSVVVLEQEGQLAYHATGRSAAAFLESYGSPEVRALTRASRPLLDATAADTDAPVLTPRPLMWVAGPGREPAIASLLTQQPRLQALTVAEARRLCPVLRSDQVAGAVVEPDAQDIDVAALHQRYVRDARRAGVTILKDSPLLGATPGPAGRDGGRGRRWRLRHPTGAITAGVVINAAGAWADRVAALLGARPCGLRPLRRTIVIARTSQPLPAGAPLVADVDDEFYFRPEGPHVLLSPADETPSEPGDARPDEAAVALAVERVNGVSTLGIRSVATAWAGLRTFAPDRNPVVGYDPDVRGLFWLAGQGGYGIQTAAALAQVAAGLVRGEGASGPGSGSAVPAAGSAAAAFVAPGLDLAAISPARFRR